MAVYLEDVSRTFGEYLLIPGLTTKQCTPVNVSLKTPLVKHPAGEKPLIELNIPFVSAIMQAVSGPELAIELARNGGLSFIFGSQPVESQAEMVRKVKKFKAGFVISDSNLTPEHTLADVVKLVKSTGHSTIGITDDGTSNGTLLGIVTLFRPLQPEKAFSPISVTVRETFNDPASCEEIVCGMEMYPLGLLASSE